MTFFIEGQYGNNIELSMENEFAYPGFDCAA